MLKAPIPLRENTSRLLCGGDSDYLEDIRLQLTDTQSIHTQT
jgi:hypothetical protein